MHNSSCKLDLPTYKRGSTTRENVQTPVELPYESLISEISENATFEYDLSTACAPGRLPPTYEEHQVSVRAKFQ